MNGCSTISGVIWAKRLRSKFAHNSSAVTALPSPRRSPTSRYGFFDFLERAAERDEAAGVLLDPATQLDAEPGGRQRRNLVSAPLLGSLVPGPPADPSQIR